MVVYIYNWLLCTYSQCSCTKPIDHTLTGPANRFHRWYSTSADSILRHFVKYSQPHHMAFLAQLYSPTSHTFISRMGHLACFFPGVLALGHYFGFPQQHLEVARNLTHTCYQMYHQSPSGLSAEEVYFQTSPMSSSDFSISVRC